MKKIIGIIKGGEIMGLDMFLSRKRYVGAEYEHREVKGTIDITIKGVKLPINFNKVSYIEESAAYWRKANAIHKWFVDNVQDGNDDCRNYYVTLEDLEELLKVCEEVKKDHSLADELLPTTRGFFFGGTEYDEWYFNAIDYTIETLKEIIKDEKELNKLGEWTEFVYHSSW
jgi:hypothetical protein